jgi:hypothetical protein
MDLNIKGLEADVVARLAEQAAAEGFSQQEWIRQVLRRTAQRLSPAELVAQRSRAAAPMTEAEFVEVRKRVAQRRQAAVRNLGASGRRR